MERAQSLMVEAVTELLLLKIINKFLGHLGMSLKFGPSTEEKGKGHAFPVCGHPYHVRWRRARTGVRQVENKLCWTEQFSVLASQGLLGLAVTV